LEVNLQQKINTYKLQPYNRKATTLYTTVSKTYKTYNLVRPVTFILRWAIHYFRPPLSSAMRQTPSHAVFMNSISADRIHQDFSDAYSISLSVFITNPVQFLFRSLEIFNALHSLHRTNPPQSPPVLHYLLTYPL